MSRTISASSKSIWGGEAMLRAEGLELHYGASRALRGVAIEARPGRVTCLLGRNGEGKSTLLKIISGSLKPDEGEIVRQQGLRIGQLPQDVPASTAGTRC